MARPWLCRIVGVVLLCLGLLWPSAGWALSANTLPTAPPVERVVDEAGVLSRAAIGELTAQLNAFEPDHIDAHLITVKRLDYGLGLPELAQDVLASWLGSGAENNQLLFLLDSQTNSATVAVSSGLEAELNTELLKSTARTTMAQPLRDGARYRQASLDGMTRLQTVLQGGEDPGEPEIAEVVTLATNIPTQEETSESNAFTWVVVLLVVGTVVPMLTWWVFSR
ncbi:MAG: TPM domain-containing protein [Cyanobium sp. LacPavin_0920_WC12_MAG_62_9]|nr:TPM domain-containing protein [Cyanobium sp. LacPavin_0920_WC12_MAG_62_9]